MKKIFAYGSLMNFGSLTATAPSARNIKPATIRGYNREFSKWVPKGFVWNGQNLENYPYCALDIIKSDNKNFVYGMVFEVCETDLESIKKRESGYHLIEVEAFGIENNKSLGLYSTFHSGKRDGKYDPLSPSQKVYDQIVLQGEKELRSSY